MQEGIPLCTAEYIFVSRVEAFCGFTLWKINTDLPHCLTYSLPEGVAEITMLFHPMVVLPRDHGRLEWTFRTGANATVLVPCVHLVGNGVHLHPWRMLGW